jgi:hypothetical protein
MTLQSLYKSLSNPKNSLKFKDECTSLLGVDGDIKAFEIILVVNIQNLEKWEKNSYQLLQLLTKLPQKLTLWELRGFWKELNPDKSILDALEKLTSLELLEMHQEGKRVLIEDLKLVE